MLRLRHAVALGKSKLSLQTSRTVNTLGQDLLFKNIASRSSCGTVLFSTSVEKNKDVANAKVVGDQRKTKVSRLRQVIQNQDEQSSKHQKPNQNRIRNRKNNNNRNNERQQNNDNQNQKNQMQRNRNQKNRNKNRNKNNNNSRTPATTADSNSSIESLRAVFLKSVEFDRERRDQGRNGAGPQQNNQRQRSSENQRESILFKTLARDRNRRAQNSPADRQKDNNRNNNRSSQASSWRSPSNAQSATHLSPKEQFLQYQQNRKDFFDTKIDQDQKLRNERKVKKYNRKKRKTRQQKKIILSNDPPQIDLRSLAGILRVKIERITKTLISLGELDASVLEAKIQEDFIDKRGNRKPKKKSKESLVSVGDRIIDIDMAELVAMELGFHVTRSDSGVSSMLEVEDAAMIGRRDLSEDASDSEDEDFDNEIDYEPRAPVVSIMGHVDHGKTTLMDALRRRSNLNSPQQQKSQKSKKKSQKMKNGQNSIQNNGGDVAGTEAGGITQVISAFEVPIEDVESAGGRNSVTFLDTPGHAAFKSMRQSGSNATDIIVLVVAADDGVSAQTVEIIDMYKKIEEESGGNISLLVAMTKIDKEGISIEESTMKIENQLMEHNIYSNDVQLVPVSGITGEGLGDLVEALVLQAQVMDLKADLKARGEGVVMDAKMEKGLGVVIDCVVRWGKLEKGDTIVSGNHMGKVKILKDVNGKAIKKAISSQPIRIVGLKSLPKAGDPIICVENEETAKTIIEARIAAHDETNLNRAKISDSYQDDLQITGSAAKEHNSRQRVLARHGLEKDEGNDNDEEICIPVLIKADADGSLDAVKESLISIGTACKEYNIKIDPIEASIGTITSNDILVAKESQAAIFCFGVKGGYDRKLVDEAGISIREHQVIYSLLDDARDIFADHLPRTEADKIHGRASVQAVFTLNNRAGDKIAGLRVKDGMLLKEKCPDTGLSCRYRVLRDGALICEEEGLIADSLRKVKEDVQNVKKGEECGLGLSSFSDLKEGDEIECFSIEMKKATI